MNLLDILIIAVVLIVALISAKKGFVKTFVEIVGSVGAMYVSYLLSTPIAKFISAKFIEPSVSKKIFDSLSETVNTATDAIPSFVKKASSLFGVNIQSADNFTGTTQEITNKVMMNVVSPVIVRFLQVIILIVLVIVLLFVVKFLAKVLNKIFSISVAGKFNKFLGFVFGLVKGVVIATLFCLVVSFFVSLNPNGFLIFTTDALESSVLFKLVIGLLPNIVNL